MKTMYPDYSQSILALTNSILFHYGVKDINHPTLKEADEVLKKNYKNVILCLFDGMGYLNMEDHKDDCPFMYSHLKRSISSVFPPTTVAATTAVLSGRSPIETGWVGWDLYFKELGYNVDVFPNKIQFSKETAADYHVGTRYLPYKNIFARIREANQDVEVNYVSDFGETPYKNLTAGKKILLDICKKEKPQFTYFYNVYPDEIMHTNGINGPKTAKWFRKLDKFVSELFKETEDTLIICIADHGLIDVEWIYLDEYPDILNALVRMPSIEARASSLFIKDEYKDSFEESFNKQLGDKFKLLSRKEVLDNKLFGEGKNHERTEDFLGDYLAIATDKYCMGISRMNNNLIAHHAGLTEKEMLVPFVMIER